ncbi:putative phosphatidylserine decarboxylase [Daldinia caldariorum]|uniref:putative phosphatidylserine decarboxylase n=1 Tax=Daldinia caldariorum TaxID=326644 RepID=UPI0020082910|nr:putative phosphatidylserine decarboxylase [Daldinia caldariorum]KAI1463813.1 putative phosphatidylserine decarboxylase [Daldinia caldariorum]
MGLAEIFRYLYHFIDSFLDHLLARCHLSSNGEYGWKSFDRKTGQLMREQQPLTKKIKLLLLFNPLTEWIDTTHLMRLWIHNKSVRKGVEEGTPASHGQIRAFVDTYGINMDDFEPSDVEKYRTFEDFFVRAHRPGSRPIDSPDDPAGAVVVADSRVVTYESVAETRKLWIKGTDFTMKNLVMDTQLGEHFADAAVASFRLSPQDYHRYHSPVTGATKTFRSIPGDYYQVDPVALQSGVNILTSNARSYLVIETEQFGDVLFVAIGATDVGTVRIHDKFQKPGTEIKKGDEIGFFQFGGSSIIVAFQKGAIKFDQDLLDLSRQKIQVSVEVGMSLGRANPMHKKVA